MKIAILGNDDACNELSSLNADIDWVRSADMDSFLNQPDADAFFYLSAENFMHHAHDNKPVFVNSVHKTLKDLQAGENTLRINGWKGFLKRPSWEIAGSAGPKHIEVLSALKRKYIVTPDEPGFISARIISMIINEAFFAREEQISTEEEIDVAMKLGTNYPYGPFEWADEIGVKNIYELLDTLSKNDNRYTASALLQQKATTL